MRKFLICLELVYQTFNLMFSWFSLVRFLDKTRVPILFCFVLYCLGQLLHLILCADKYPQVSDRGRAFMDIDDPWSIREIATIKDEGFRTAPIVVESTPEHSPIPKRNSNPAPHGLTRVNGKSPQLPPSCLLPSRVAHRPPMRCSFVTNPAPHSLHMPNLGTRVCRVVGIFRPTRLALILAGNDEAEEETGKNNQSSAVRLTYLFGPSFNIITAGVLGCLRSPLLHQVPHPLSRRSPLSSVRVMFNLLTSSSFIHKPSYVPGCNVLRRM